MQPRAAVLLYHRVVDTDTDPQLLCVSPRNFDEHLEVISQFFQPVRLGELAHLMREGRDLHRRVVLTFDDGYSDNLHQGKPLLEKHGVPATVFVSSGYIGQRREFWWDELERLLLVPNELPETLTVASNGQVYSWDLGRSEGASHSCKKWNVLQSQTPTRRQAAYLALHRILKPLNERARSQVLRDLAQTVGLSGEG